MKRQWGYLGPLLTFLFLPATVVVVTEFFKNRLIWLFRTVDFFDLVISAPIYMISATLLLRTLTVEKYRIWLVLTFMVLIYGHAMHVTANAIATYSFEIRDYQAIFPEDSKTLLFYLDEILSHQLFFTGLFGFLNTILIADIRNLVHQPTVKIPLWLMSFLGLSYGAGLCLALIEGQQIFWGMILVLTTGVVLINQLRSGEQSLIGMISRSHLTQFMIPLLLVVLLGLIGSIFELM